MSLKRPYYNYNPNKFYNNEKNKSYNLNETEQNIAKKLATNSIAVTHFDDLFPQYNFNDILDYAEKERLEPRNLEKVRFAEKGIQEESNITNTKNILIAKRMILFRIKTYIIFDNAFFIEDLLLKPSI